jgi:hypothetical protein
MKKRIKKRAERELDRKTKKKNKEEEKQTRRRRRRRKPKTKTKKEHYVKGCLLVSLYIEIYPKDSNNNLVGKCDDK